MSNIIKILAICGSTRKDSTNLRLIHAIRNGWYSSFEMDIYLDIASLPHFNPDLDTENPPAVVSDFRSRLRAADGILICTPEYAMGLPGSLKNALDWTVSSCEFSKKPVAAITASSMGEKAHASLIATLKIIEANITEDTALLIPYASTKINRAGEITDKNTLADIQRLMSTFLEMMR
jgi:chromate reductase